MFRSSIVVLAAVLVALTPAAAAPAAKRKAPKGPSVTVAKRALESVLREQYGTAAVPPAKVRFGFASKLRVLKGRKANPNAQGNVNDAGGRITIWPVRVNIRMVLPQDDDPSDDTYCRGTWVNEQFMFHRTAKGRWTWYAETISAKKGLPDTYGPNAPCV